MGLLGPISILGGFILVAVFLVMWHFRGRGFGELLHWRQPEPRPGSGPRDLL